MKPVLLINPNSSTATTDAMVRIARRYLPQVIGWTNAQAPKMITEPEALARAGEHIANAELPEAAGVIVAAFGDPGRDALAQRLAVPVVGIGAAARDAARGTFAVATTTPDLEEPIDTLMSVKSGYLGCFFTEGDPLHLAGDANALDAVLRRAVERAAQAGAESVIIGGGPLAEAAARIADACPVPLIQPLPAACARLA
jgi:Asp/Glu/hydantoin racemase